MLITGNVAKLYSLNWISKQIEAKPNLSILDLGCGTASPFTELLKQYQQVRYVGLEPIKDVYEVARRNLPNATILNMHAYNVYATLKEQFDIVTSFSVFEHVFKRQEYLKSAKECLAQNGHFVINYDAGHFVVISGGHIRLKRAVARTIRAYFGDDRFYRAFVAQKDFQSLIDAVGFQVDDIKHLNTWLKSIFKFIPEAHKEEFMQRWLDFELWINEIGTPYDDSKAGWFLTTNYILKHADLPPTR